MKPWFRRFGCLALLVAVSLVTASHASWALSSAGPAPDVVALHLAGRWRASELQNRELGRPGPAEIDSLVIRPDAAVGRSIPKEVEARVAGRPVALSGTLFVNDGKPLGFLLVQAPGSSRLLFFPAGVEKPRVTEIYVTLAPARDHRADVLFVGVDEADNSVVAFERATQAAERGLAPPTLELLQTVTSLRSARSPSLMMALRSLPQQPDWQRVTDIVMEELQDDPLSDQNNRCLLVQGLIEEHLGDIRIDVEPLIHAVSAARFTNQQKCAQALAAAAKRPQLLAGKEERIVEALLPLVASQRGRVVDPALEVLGRWSGQQLGRDPVAWEKLFRARYGRDVSLKGVVYELLIFLRYTAATNGDLRISVSEDPGPAKPTLTSEEVQQRLRTFAERATKRSVAPRVVVISDEALKGSGEKQDASETKLLALLEAAGLSDQTAFAPETDRFYPPFEPGFP